MRRTVHLALLVALGGPACGDGSSAGDQDAGTEDPCDPNPCTELHKNVCAASGGDAVCSCDPGWLDDGAGGCVAEVCDPGCEADEHCESGACVANECIPACAAGETCLEHWADACQCGDGPRCAEDEACVDGDCTCIDECVYGATKSGGSETCDLWDRGTEAWVSIGDGSESLRNRARLYDAYLREKLLPAGGVANALFTDQTLANIAHYQGVGDSAIWTGTYLAAEALRYLATGSSDAQANVDALVRTLHDWWRVSGDTGYLARYAAPADSDARILALFNSELREHHLDVSYDGKLWNWMGHISRDQYQGVMLGYSLAYEATGDDAVKELIRADVVEFVEQLMKSETKQLYVDGFPMSVQMQYCVFTDDETESGNPEISIDGSNYENSEMWGFQEFQPNLKNLLGQILGDLVPEIPRAGSAIMLASFFHVALQVTEGVPAYATRRQAIQEHYDDNAGWWLDMAEHWGEVRNECGESYFGINIDFEPMYNLARLESDATLRARIRQNVLADLMWAEVADHKNVFFAYIYAANQASSAALETVIDTHGAQLALFPPGPRVHEGRDLTGEYAESGDCSGQAAEATDVDDRCVDDFMWQRHPWRRVDAGDLRQVYPGVDYLVAYWMGRYHGFLDEDAPDTCLRWRQ